MVKKARRNKNQGIKVKGKFKNAISRLRRMKPVNQRNAALASSNEFIRDISSLLSRVRGRPDLLKANHRNVLKRHRLKLKKLVHAKTPITAKRLILSQTGGILPLLVPIITALIGAGGAIGGAATHAAISKR